MPLSRESRNVQASEGFGRDEMHERGIELFEEGRFEEASQLISAALLDSETSERWNDWAAIVLTGGRVDEAEKAFRRALEMDSENSQAAANLGLLLVGLDRSAEAVPFLERGLAGAEGEERTHLTDLLEALRSQSVPPTVESDASPSMTARSGSDSARTEALEPDTGSHLESLARGVPRHARGEPLFRAEERSMEETQKETSAPGIFFQAYIYGGSGYADESQNVALGLARRRLPVQLNPLVFQSDTRNLLSPRARHTLGRMKQHTVDLSRSVYYQCVPAHDFNLQVQARCRVGRTMFETDRIPDGWAERCQAMDEIWLPSEFNRETFASSGVDEDKLRVVPAGVDTLSFRPGLEPLPLGQLRGFNFLSVFEWTDRKGADVLLKAYLNEFKADEDVALILRTYARADPHTDLLPKLAYFVEREVGLSLEQAPPIVLLNGFLSNADMPRLYSTADAFALPSRGEGYGRPYMEALACECPVIATRWSGQTDFLHDGNSYLVDVESVVPAPQDVDVELFAGHCWAEPSVEHLRQLMRQVVTDREEAQGRAARGRADMVKNLDWNVVTDRWASEFERLLDAPFSVEELA